MYSKLQDGSFIIAGFVAKDAEMKKSQNGKTYTNWSVKVGEKPSAVQGSVAKLSGQTAELGMMQQDMRLRSRRATALW